MQTRSKGNPTDAAHDTDSFIPATPTPEEDNMPPAPGRDDDPTPQRPRRVPDNNPPVTSTPITEATFSQASVSALISALQKSQTDAFRDIIESVIRTPPVVSSDSHTLARCRASFSGSSSESVTAFIDSVDSYIDCCKVSDTNILKGLSMLLQGDAAIWWQGLKEQIADWAEAKENLISAFGDRRPPHRIYIDIFNNPQRTENTDLFVSKLRSLFSRLPKNDISENAKLDITYGLLHTRIKAKLRREEFSSFAVLLRLARDIEDSSEEERKSARSDIGTRAPLSSSKPLNTPPAAQTARNRVTPAANVPATIPIRPAHEPQRVFTATPVYPSPATNTDLTGNQKQRPQCTYCKRYNHTRDQCRKLATKSSGESNSNFPANIGDSGDKGKESFYSVELPSSCNNNNNKCVNSVNKCIRSNRIASSNNNLNVIISNNNTENTPNNANHVLSSCLPVANDASNYLENSSRRSSPRSSVSKLRRPPRDAPALEPKLQTTKCPPSNTCNIQNNNNVCYRNWVSHNNACACVRSEENTNSDFVCNVKPKHFCSHKIDDATCYSTRAKGTNKLPVCVNSSGANCIVNLPVCINSSGANCMEKLPHTLCTCESKSCHGDYIKNVCNCDIQKSHNLLTGENVVNNFSLNDISGDCICSGDVLTSGNNRERPLACREIRPIFKIEILGVCGTALIDTGAKHCIAGHTLYALLLRKGQPLVASTRQIKLADGHVRNMEVLTTTLAVSLDHTVIQVPFLIFPDSDNNETLLGIDFITAAGVVIDFHKEIWYFSKNNDIKHKLLFEPTSRQISCSSADVLRDDEGAQLNPAERNALAEVLVRHANIFEAGGGPTPFAEHCIDTGNHPPIAVPPYRLNPAKKELMKQEINKLINDDVIEECESAWCSPALMVPKPDGTIRFCVDYRRLNAITKSDNYPMPRIDELLQSTKRNCYMSSLDLRSSYYQVSVRESDKDKTAFISPLGTYRFKRMPFGLKNAPATFQRLIDRLRSCAALKEVTILAYLDDILVISDGFEQHLEDLELVMKRLEEFNLQVNRKKCFFARESVRYLGHIITQEGISTDPQKVNAVVDMNEPTNLKHLRTFLQTCSWFRKFIPNFSKIAEPLTRLTRKSQVWIWSGEQSHAFNELKRLLTSAPILVQPDFNSPFILRTDASNYALGAVLLQGEGNQERPIEYASRLLNDAERNYSTTEREALAVVWAVERFRSYLDGQPVIIGSDHQPLRWLLTLKSPTGRLIRWALKLQSFDIKFEYTPGKANVVADTLSRPICSSGTVNDCGICSIVCDLPTKSPNQLRQEQLSDPEVTKIIKDIEGTDEIASQRWYERGYLMNQGVLYRHNPDSESESPQLVIPAEQVVTILQELHDSSLAGHPGIDRTYQKVAQLFYFTGMRKRISDYVGACVHCQRYKASNAKPTGLLQTPVMSQRNEVLAIDLFGPLPEGDQGERWVFLIEDTATRWVELFALQDATAEACARVLIEEYFLRFGLPRRIISDNGVQFVSAIMRQCMSVLDIKQNFVPLYHPQANPAERKNRDLKAMLAYLVEEDHTSWPKKLPLVRFALNGSRCRTTGMSPAYLTFAREMRSPAEVTHDTRAILSKENFEPQITPYLRKFINSLSAIRERVEIQQDKTKEYADQSRRPAETFQVGDLVLLKSHVLSSARKNVTAKFAPKRDGPYQISNKVSPTTYILSNVDHPKDILGKYHIQDLTAYKGNDTSLPNPVIPKRKRGRPATAAKVLVQERGRSPRLEGECIVNHSANLPHRASRGRVPARFLL